MRLVSEFREVKGNPVMMGKHMRLRVRQASFTALIGGHPNDDIMLLDYESEESTLRKMIMQIQSGNKDTPENLFYAVVQDWKGRFIITFLQTIAAEAIRLLSV